MAEVVALVVHAEEHIVVLSIESLVAFRTFQCSEVVLFLLLLLDPDEVEADLLSSELLTTSLALHHFDIEHLVAIAAVLSVVATAVRSPLASLRRLHHLVVVICRSKHICLLLLAITRPGTR